MGRLEAIVVVLVWVVFKYDEPAAGIRGVRDLTVLIKKLNSLDAVENGGNGDLNFQGNDTAGGESDALYDQAVQIVLQTRRPSISLVQRHLRIGYNRAARLIEQMEQSGLVSPMQSNGNREVLVPARPE